jgi:EmrB/QacA subfamily drug resistance transporter
MAAMVAPGLGPTLGGWLATSVSWHWLFLVNVPIGALAVLAGLRLVPELGHRERRPFDGLGLVLGCGGLALTVLGLSEANDWGWTSPATLACTAAGVGGLVAFVRHELGTTTPMIDLRMFGERSFRLAIGTMLLVVIAQFGRLVYIPLALESLRGFSALRVGVLFLPAGVVSAASMQWGGRLSDRHGPRTPILIGCSIMFLAVAGFGTLTLTTPAAAIAGLMALQGLGLGFITAPAMVAGLSSLPAHLVSQGTAVRSLTSQVGGALAVAVLGTVVAARMGDSPSPAHAQASYNTAFLVAAAGMVVAGVLAWRLPRRAPSAAGAPEALALAE